MTSNARSWLAMVVMSACLGGKYAGSLGVYTEGVDIGVDDEKKMWCMGVQRNRTPHVVAEQRSQCDVLP